MGLVGPMHGPLRKTDLVKFKMVATAAKLEGWYAKLTFVWLLATYPEKMGLIGPMVL